MTIELSQPVQLGQFTIDTILLSRLLGFPEGTEIKHVMILPYQQNSTPSLRVVVESGDLPETPPGQEIPTVRPQYGAAGGQYRFQGWVVQTVREEPQKVE